MQKDPYDLLLSPQHHTDNEPSECTSGYSEPPTQDLGHTVSCWSPLACTPHQLRATRGKTESSLSLYPATRQCLAYGRCANACQIINKRMVHYLPSLKEGKRKFNLTQRKMVGTMIGFSQQLLTDSL